MLVPDIVRNISDLEQILVLQQKNLKEHLSAEERKSQGFLTLSHSLEILHAMHSMAPSIVIRDQDVIVAYALTEMPACRHLMPGLEPMFELIDTLDYKGRPLSSYLYYTMGQICVDEQYRGRGLFDQLYEHHRQIFAPTYQLLITEISTSNTRSLQAHRRVGFEELSVHRDDLDEWSLVVWDWMG